jgi:hypothetical protein
MTTQVSSVYEYDHSLDWTKNCRRRAYAIVAAADHEIVEPSDEPEGDAAVVQWERKCAAETVKYFETERDQVVAEAEADTKPVDVDRAVRLGTEMARKQNLETGPEAVAYATDRLKAKLERDAVYNPISEVHAGFLSYRFLKGMPGGEKVVYMDRYKGRKLSKINPMPTPDLFLKLRD